MTKKAPQKGTFALPELVSLGLTDAEAKSYQLLLTDGAANAQELAGKLGLFPNAVYRLMRGLGQKGFVVELQDKPATFQPIPSLVAIEAFSRQKIREIEELKIRAFENLSQTKKASTSTRITLITGRKAMFSLYVALAESATREILIISIGESTGDDIKLANRDALERNVAIKMIAHRYDKSNEELLQNWVAMGIEVKHIPDWGFHLVIFDGEKSILAINNPKRTEERISILIENKGLSEALRTYYFTLWKKARPIKLS